MRQDDDPPSAWIQRFAPLIRSGGTVLDLACGQGRHTRYLESRGHRLVAADVDVSGLADLACNEAVTVLQCDFERGPWPFRGSRFDAIVITNYLHRPLLPRLVDSLGPDGVLLYETFAKGNERYGRPRRPEFLLEPGELYDAFAPRLTVVAYEHGFEATPRPAVRQRICATSASGEPAPLFPAPHLR